MSIVARRTRPLEYTIKLTETRCCDCRCAVYPNSGNQAESKPKNGRIAAWVKTKDGIRLACTDCAEKRGHTLNERSKND